MTMRYVSTRSATAMGSFTDILLEGLAQDGGLAVPQAIPIWSPEAISSLSGLAYPQLAARVVHAFANDLSLETLEVLASKAYTVEKFGHPSIAPLTVLQEAPHSRLALLELSNGPTMAFKDMAMQLLGQLFEYQLKQKGQTLNILGATSGDTGSSAEYAMRDKQGISVFMLSPEGRMSQFQKAQMYSLQEPHIHNLTVKGSFDDCQDMVKAVSADLAFKSSMRIGTVNSINWARITAQVVYYFAGYFQAVSAFGLRFGEPVDFCVPSGNFGNVFAGWLLTKMGIKMGGFRVATNQNDVLHRLFDSGKYSLDKVSPSLAPSMDIQVASNFERLLFYFLGGNSEHVNEVMSKFRSEGRYSFEKFSIPGFSSSSTTDEEIPQLIKKIWTEHDYLVDPHTACAFKNLTHDQKAVILATAHPAKFPQVFEQAGLRRPTSPTLDALLNCTPQKYNVSVDPAEVRSFMEQKLK